MYVLDDCRGKGTGSKLIVAFTDWCKTKDVKRLRVIASAMNIRAIEFYKKKAAT